MDIDSADLWPRYYFDLGRAKAEVEAWMACRRLIPKAKVLRDGSGL